MVADTPGTVEEVDKALEACRATLPLMMVTASKRLVWEEVDRLLDLRDVLAHARLRVLS